MKSDDVDKNIKILVVEDSAITAMGVSQNLKIRGFTAVEIVSTGKQAVETVRSCQYGLILMDIMLDGVMTGIEAVKEIQSIRNVPIIFTTALTDEETLNQAKVCNPYGYIIKPYDMFSFNLTIELVLKRYKLEQQIEKSEKKYRELYDNLRDALAEVDMDGFIIHANFIFLEMTGYSFDDLKQLRFTDITPEKWHKKETEIINTQVLQRGYSDLFEKEYIKKDTSIISIELRIYARYEDLKPVSMWALVRDISERKTLEERYRQSQKMEAVGRLAGGIAHDFNNLLTVINGYSQMLLLQTDENDIKRQYALEIHDAGKRASELTSQLLVFSRQRILQPKVININTVIEQMQKMLQRIIGENIVMNISLDSSLSNIIADKGQIEQVMLNLIVNAREAISGFGKISIITENNPEVDILKNCIPTKSDLYIKICVSDTGCGIDDSLKSLVFEPFFSTKKDRGGTGLGLSIVYGIVKQCGGFIEIDSVPESGSSFKIYLPVTEKQPDKEQSPNERIIPGKESILVVEDEPAVRDFVVEGLKSNGYTVHSAENGAEGIKKFESLTTPIDLILTDVIMPVMNGHDMVNTLKKTYPSLKIIYMSGYTDDFLSDELFNKNEIDFIQKPFTLLELIHKIQIFLTGCSE